MDQQTETQSRSQPEVKAEKFRKLAVQRANRALQAMYMLGHLSNRNAYLYTEAQVGMLLAQLREGIDDIESRFRVANGARKAKQLKLF